MTNRARRAAQALREAADAIDELPPELRFQRPGLLGMTESRMVVEPKVLREEADRIDRAYQRMRDLVDEELVDEKRASRGHE